MPLTHHDLDEIAQAKELLENPSLAVRITDLVGMPIEALVKRLHGRSEMIGLSP